jgi:hypothetical protein
MSIFSRITDFLGVPLTLKDILWILGILLVLYFFLPFMTYFAFGVSWTIGAVIRGREDDPSFQHAALVFGVSWVFWPVMLYVEWLGQQPQDL